MRPGRTRAWRGGAASVGGFLSALGKLLRPVLVLLALATLATLLTHYGVDAPPTDLVVFLRPTG